MSESDRLSGILKETAGLFVISVVASSVLLSRRHTRKAAAQKLNSTSSGPIIMSAFGNSFLASVGSFITAGAYFRMRAGEITVIYCDEYEFFELFSNRSTMFEQY
jgi:hypothetical protein